MSTTEVHQLMLTLGVLVCPLMAVAALPGISERWKRWLVGLLAGLLVAVTPYISRFRDLDPATELLRHSLLIAAIGLAAILLLILLATRPDQQPRAGKRDRRRVGKARNILPAVRDDTPLTSPANDANLPPLPARGVGFPAIHISAESGLPAISAALVKDNPLDESRVKVNAEASRKAAEPALDLTAAERLYTNSRQQTDELRLPANREWLTQAEADPAASDQAVAAVRNLSEPISEAEFTVPGDDPDYILEFGDDLTGEYSHPALPENSPDDTSDVDWEVDAEAKSSPDETEPPGTLEAALEHASAAATSMASQVAELQHGVTEINSAHQTGAVELCVDQLVQANTLNHRQALYSASSETYAAAEAVIAVQHKLLEETTAQRKLIAQKWRLEHARVTVHKQEVERLREMARDAAQLARKAALAQQNIRDSFIREQAARLKSEKSARRAVGIARNAITALTAEERKNRIPET